MEVIVAQVAAAVASVLAPFTPYLVEGGKKFAGKAGEAAWTKAEKIWKAIKSHFADDSAIKGASLLLSDSPQDESTIKLFATTLAKKLEGNSQCAQELLDLIGGKDSLQEVLVEKSWIGKVVQELTGDGKQSATVQESIVGEISQKKFTS